MMTVHMGKDGENLVSEIMAKVYYGTNNRYKGTKI